jgi:hypothetical protein
MAKRGAKPKYDICVKPYLAEINDKIRRGVTEAEIAKALGISIASLHNYKNAHPELAEALSKDRGVDVLQGLINSGIEAAQGRYIENEQTVYRIDENGEPVIEKVIKNKVWQPPNPALHKFYVLNFGKDQGLVNDPLEFELKKKKQEFDEAVERKRNWLLFQNDK